MNYKDIYQCQITNCGYTYNPNIEDRRNKIKMGTKFEDLPTDWKCPVCGASKKSFKPWSNK